MNLGTHVNDRPKYLVSGYRNGKRNYGIIFR